MSARTAVLTTTHRQHAHLMGQVDGLGVSTRAPDLHVVVAMDDVEVARRRLPITTDRWPTLVPTLRGTSRGLPRAAARNLAAQTAIEHGADVLVFLDADCIPGPRMLQTYAAAAHHADVPAPALWSGEVQHLGPAPTVGYPVTDLSSVATVDGGRTPLRAGEVRPDPRFEGSWSRSFAISTQDWLTTGGFCEDYVGCGAEDLDFGQLVRQAGGSLTRLGGATTYRQHQTNQDSPPPAVDAIVRNAGIFYDRWGWWPMPAMLEDFRRQGLAGQETDTGRWRVAA
ncbi:MAG: glycosyltransferase family 2 protein [Ornithinimicrobium sp.]|uniref:glycosyltransferase family 2 protein n=1 Tax=Ornithinimicrobium sp. TaxID=1977084 RepID=UPI0017F2928B|nr:glycosyltransferase family 2 protein [Actinomycetota bacterium]